MLHTTHTYEQLFRLVIDKQTFQRLLQINAVVQIFDELI